VFVSPPGLGAQQANLLAAAARFAELQEERNDCTGERDRGNDVGRAHRVANLSPRANCVVRLGHTQATRAPHVTA
jgi:hypothetical protein